MMITRNITWNVVRHILHDIKQLRHMCTVSSLYQDKGIWLRTLKRENMLEIENIWKSRVQADNDSRLQDHENEDRKKFYVLSMFPYPSGKLHMGHVRVYTISDTMARYHRMLGHEVIHPMGWDAFGLPAENAAKDRNLHPKEWTYRNIAMMKEQLQNLCCTFDWDRELTTCDPTYYRWTQYIFLKMYEAGLAYQAHAVVNWDPVDQTVLADEQIDEHGRSWRSGAVAEKKYLKQWFIKTTVYGKALYDGLDTVNEELWADVIALQKHWIGKATGCRFEFTIKDDMSEAVASNYLINHNRAGQVMIETTGQDNERSKKKPRTNNFFEVTVPSYTPSDFKSHFRMLPSIFEMLCTLIADKMEMSRSVPVTKKILCTIWLLANTESYRSVADRFNVSKGQLHAIVHSVCHALIGLKDQYIKWPRNDKLEEMSKDWAEKHHTHNSRFPGVVGSVDGTYIPIQGCGGQDRDAYICRKGFPAMHLQNGNVVFEDKMAVFTDAPECIYGISHLAVDISHMFNSEEYYKEVKKDPLTGEDVILLNLLAVHPVTGQDIPIVVTKMEQEDHARKIVSAIGIPNASEDDERIAELFDLPWQTVMQNTGENEVMINSKQFDGLIKHEAKEEVMKLAREEGFGGHPGTKLFSDWLISRQRYWGTPIPIIHCDHCGTVPVPYEDLPVILPDNIDVTKNQSGSPLQNDEQWINVTCPRCGRPAKRETDTMDTFVDSSWYFLRYLDPHNLTEPVSSTLANKYMPVDLYIGGKEHAQLHLYFARFFNYFLSVIGILKDREPFVDLLTQGMVKGESYRVKKTGQYIQPNEAEKRDNKFFQKGTNEPLEVKYEKMSKSKLNGVDPEELFTVYGVDLTRLCILSGVAPRSDRNWNLVAYDGVQRWLNRVWHVTGVLVKRSEVTGTSSDVEMEEWNKKIRKFRNEYLVEINRQINSGFVLNIVIARLQELTTDLRRIPAEVAVNSVQYERSVVDLALILAPLAPMLASELWMALSNAVIYNKDHYDFTKSVHQQRWPEVDSDAIVPVPVTCNGRKIGSVFIEQKDIDNISLDSLLAMTKDSDNCQKVIKDFEITSANVKTYGPGVIGLNLKVPEVEKQMQERKTEQKNKKKKKKEQKNKQIDAA